MKNLIKLSFILITATLLFSSCEDEEVFEAQDCMNQLSDSDTTNALNCFNKLGSASGPQADRIRCAAKLKQAGLSNNRLYAAFQFLIDNENDTAAEAGLISRLSVDPSNISILDEARSFCSLTESSSQTFIAGQSYLGTILRNVPGYSESDPSAAIDFCSNPANAAACQSDEVVSIVEETAEIYCNGDTADEEVCQDIADAQASGNLSETLFCLLDGGTFNGTTCVGN